MKDKKAQQEENWNMFIRAIENEKDVKEQTKLIIEGLKILREQLK